MSAKKPSLPAGKVQTLPRKAIRAPAAKPLLTDVRTLILEARQRVALAVNAGLTLLYWHI